MDKKTDQRGILDKQIFTYRITKDKKVFLEWYGKQVKVLSGSKALDFIENIMYADDKEAQLIR